jgi:hypothetical protein
MLIYWWAAADAVHQPSKAKLAAEVEVALLT